ncbi:MAG: Adaptive-response sensory-kinase SasA [bacterium]|nr:Adaptive-response sensory-kinase SasA [bacterium]
MVGTIVALMSLALLGLIGVQLYLLDHAMELKKQAFRQNVNAAMSSIVQQLETKEMATKVFNVALNVAPRDQMAVVGMHFEHDNMLRSDSLRVTGRFMVKDQPQFKIDSNRVWYELPTAQHVRLALLDSLGQKSIQILNEFKPAGKHEQVLHSLPFKKGVVFLSFTTDSTSFVTKVRAGETNEIIPPPISSEKRQMIIRKVVDDITTAKFVPFEARVKPAILDSLIDATLNEKGIVTAYAYGVVSAPRDSLFLAKPAKFDGELKRSEFRSRLFPNDIFAAPDDLVLYFPQQNIYLLKQMIGLLSSSFILLGVVVCGFVYTVRTIYKQRQFAGLMVDFINNMTHEFKTPISTIALASEALANPEIGRDGNRLLRYSRIIRDENTRMRNQVEKILEMAALEEGDYELNIAAVDAHKIIAEAVQNIVLQIEKRGGKIECQLRASAPIIAADEVHLANIIHNLLDNANKYSPETPVIKIATENEGTGLRIRISDNGIGLRPEDQKRVFEKYYRVPTGNVHDVKGFGLGLSYVKLMVEAHGGTITVRSDYQKGSEFEIWLPSKRDT